MNSAFFGDGIPSAIEQARVRYTISVTFARFAALKEKIEARMDWQPIDCGAECDCDAFEENRLSESFGEDRARRFLFIQQFKPKQ